VVWEPSPHPIRTRLAELVHLVDAFAGACSSDKRFNRIFVKVSEAWEYGLCFLRDWLVVLAICFELLFCTINISEQIAEVLKLNSRVVELANELSQEKSLLVMGRGYNYATCLEGALVCSALAALI